MKSLRLRATVIRALPEALIDAVRECHSAATKKEIARVAFLTVILAAEHDPEHTQALHDLAMDTKDSSDE